MKRLSAIERAYEIARSGRVANLTDIKRQLKDEGFGDVDGRLFGRALHADLQRLCAEARGTPVRRRKGQLADASER